MHRGRIRTHVGLCCLVLLGLAGVGAAGPAEAACSPSPNANIASVSLSPSGTSSQVGTVHTITATVMGAGASGNTPLGGVCVSFDQVSGPSVGWPREATTAANGTASVSYTSDVAGTDTLIAQAFGSQTVSSNRVTHSWTSPPPPPPPSPSPSPSPSQPPPSPSPSPTPRPSQTTRPRPSPSPSHATGTPTPSSTPPGASPTPAGSSAPPGSTPSPTGSAGLPPSTAPVPSTSPGLVAPPLGPPGSGPAVALDRPSALPGGSVGLAGQGCVSGTDVVLTVGGAKVGNAVADSAGHFTAGLALPDLPVGGYAVDVTCGDRHASVPIDLVVASSGPIAGSLAATASAVLLFFVLLGGMLLYRDAGVRRRPLENDDELEDDDLR